MCRPSILLGVKNVLKYGAVSPRSLHSLGRGDPQKA